MTEKLLIHVTGNLFTDGEVLIMYRHPERETQWRFLDTIALEEIAIKVVDTKRYGYRYYDTDLHRFVSASMVAIRLEARIKEKLNENDMPYEGLYGGIDNSGNAEYHLETP